MVCFFYWKFEQFSDKKKQTILYLDVPVMVPVPIPYQYRNIIMYIVLVKVRYHYQNIPAILVLFSAILDSRCLHKNNNHHHQRRRASVNTTYDHTKQQQQLESKQQQQQKQQHLCEKYNQRSQILDMGDKNNNTVNANGKIQQKNNNDHKLPLPEENLEYKDQNEHHCQQQQKIIHEDRTITNL